MCVFRKAVYGRTYGVKENSMKSKRNLVIGVAFLVVLTVLAVGERILETRTVAEAAGVQAPTFEVDPLWPKPLPNHWLLGNTIGVSVDAQDHVWIIHRGGSLEEKEVYATANPPRAECCVPAPPILEFDQAGNLLHHWGGKGEGYEWPDSNHGVTVDYKGNVWIGGNGRGTAPGAAAAGARGARGAAAAVAGQAAQGAAPNEAPVAGVQGYFHDSMIMKFTQDGKFLMQVGKPGASKGSNDVENLRLPAKIFVDRKTNEVYVADGYGNHRVIVFDADTGKYKRHWGAYGKMPDDAPLGPYNPDAPPAQQFRNPVHCAELSNDDLVYVCDRSNDRIQVFKKDGTFVKEQFIAKRTLGDGSVWDIAFSRDPQQKYLYLVDGANEKVYIMLRDSLEILTSFGDGGRQPGQFYAVHSIATDSKGNIYTTETYRGQRVQRFLYKGLATVSKQDQGTLWPRK
jgi:DNA-binding beta-propeller fold protein YncE